MSSLPQNKLMTFYAQLETEKERKLFSELLDAILERVYAMQETSLVQLQVAGVKMIATSKPTVNRGGAL